MARHWDPFQLPSSANPGNSLKILVTGGAGFLGKVLVRKLHEEHFETVLIDSKQCDLSDPKSVPNLLKVDADFVFHLAGKTKLRSASEFYLANLDTTRSVLEYCRIRKTPMHYVSTYVYGNQGAGPISEKILPNPSHPYAHSKWLAEEMCLFYARSFSIPITLSRPFNIYGPLQSTDFFIPSMIKQLRTQELIKLRNPHAKRDFVFVEDVAEGLIALMKQGRGGHIYNIGTGICFSCEEVIEHLQQLLNFQKPIVLESATEEIVHAQADIQKICTETNWRPKHSLTEGLLKCL